MTRTIQRRIAAIALISAAGAAFAQGPAPAPTTALPAAGEQSARPARGARPDPAQWAQRRAEHHARRMAELKSRLAIKPAQEGAWAAFAAATQPSAPAGARPDRAAFARMTTPERIDRMQQFAAERQQAMARRGEATKAFYAQLDATQRRTFDEQFLRAAHRHGDGHGHAGGPDGHHRKHGEHAVGVAQPAPPAAR